MASNNHFFEGAEKLLEVWFLRTEPGQNLRHIAREDWEEVLKTVRCQIISTIKNDSQDAYLLSESSMFVSERRFILKTCGTTLLHNALPLMLELAKQKCGFHTVEDIFYSRKNFLRPELQHNMHRSFEEEVIILEKLFQDGAAYCLGRMNGDCWYLYTTNNPDSSKPGQAEPDQTLEILMMDLEPEAMKLFHKNSIDPAEIAKISGIADLEPGTLIDDFLFEPCGYSMNGLLPDGAYMNIHVTPEKDFSYASFETNVSKKSYADLVKRVLNVFKPGRFVMTLFANMESQMFSALEKGGSGDRAKLTSEVYPGDSTFEDKISDFQRQDWQASKFSNYYLTFCNYAKVKAKPS
ncbi:S-adenosylmethionine decarboxylase proenzyme-like isoform X1 [Branchiostoma floridae x Branchiostoma japonicum]